MVVFLKDTNFLLNRAVDIGKQSIEDSAGILAMFKNQVLHSLSPCPAPCVCVCTVAFWGHRTVTNVIPSCCPLFTFSVYYCLCLICICRLLTCVHAEVHMYNSKESLLSFSYGLLRFEFRFTQHFCQLKPSLLGLCFVRYVWVCLYMYRPVVDISSSGVSPPYFWDSLSLNQKPTVLT